MNDWQNLIGKQTFPNANKAIIGGRRKKNRKCYCTRHDYCRKEFRSIRENYANCGLNKTYNDTIAGDCLHDCILNGIINNTGGS